MIMNEITEWIHIHPILSKIFFSAIVLHFLYSIGYQIGHILFKVIN